MSDKEKMQKMFQNFSGTFDDFVFLFIQENKVDFPKNRLKHLSETIQNMQFAD